MTETIDEKLRRLNEELANLLGKSEDARSNIDLLIDFGFTRKEAEIWLKKEISFGKDIVKKSKSRRLYRTISAQV